MHTSFQSQWLAKSPCVHSINSMTQPPRSVTVPCTFCSTLNRLDIDRMADRPKCGKCARPILLDRPLRLSDANFDTVIKGSTLPVAVDFYAEWCQPCKIMAPALDEVAHEHHDHILIAKIDTDKNPAVSMRFNIRGVPTLIVFENGTEARRQSGAMPQKQIEQFLGV
jgi:thioredoxin 2